MKLLLIDGSNLIFRAYYATENNPIKTLDDIPANAIYTLIPMINKLIEVHKPTHMFIALDTGKSTFRHDAYPEYKGKRGETPEKLKLQFPLVKGLYEAMGIRYDGSDKFEADDLIATYARKASRLGYKVDVVSGDKDLLQLVDENITVITPKLGFSKEVIYTPEEFLERFTFTPDKFTQYKALMGDSSDNIIGINKVGNKTATKFINNYDSLDDIVEAAKSGEIKGVVGNNLKDSLKQLEDNMYLVTLIDNVELKYDFDEIEFTCFDYEKFIKYLKSQGFTKFVTQFSSKYEIEEDKISFDLDFANVQEKEVIMDVPYHTIKNFTISEHTSVETYIYTQTLGSNYTNTDKLGFGIYSDKGLFYIKNEDINQEFKDFLKSDAKKITYDLKRLMFVSGVEFVNGFTCDIFVAASVLNNQNYKRDIDSICYKFGFEGVPTYESVYGKLSKPLVPSNELLEKDITIKAYALSKIYISVLNTIEEKECTKIFYDIEMPLIQVLSRIEQRGVLVNLEKLEVIESEYLKIMEKLLSKISNIVSINIDSPKALNEYLFIEKKLPTKGIKKTQTGFSTDADSLGALRNMLLIDEETYGEIIKLIDYILEYRKYKKIHSTYLVGLKSNIVGGKVYPIYHQLLTETGRLSATDPNIQNIPIRTKEAAVIRSLFTPPENNKIVAIDYSQVELRIIAAMAKEDHMISDFASGLDIHAQTAKKILGKEQITPRERSQAKAINFGIIYGMSQYGLAKQLDITNSEAKNFIDVYFNEYPKILQYMEDMKDFARSHQYVMTAFDRKREIPSITTGDRREREAGERIAINTPIQGTAADIIKLSMVHVDKFITDNNLKIEMVMQIHDELVFYCPINELSYVDKIKEVMENVVELSVHLDAEANVGDDWLETK